MCGIIVTATQCDTDATYRDTGNQVTKVPKTLAQLRKRAGMTQEQLAVRLGVARQTVGMWETGERTPRLCVAKQLALMFKVRVDDIAFQPDQPPTSTA